MRSARCAVLLAVLVVASGCARTVDGDPRAGEASSTTVSVRELIGTWRGTYHCAQGETAVDLDVTSTSQPGSDLPRAAAVMTFGPVPSNPRVERGSYRMTVVNEHGNTFRFTQQEWISRPAEYVMVDLVGELVGNTLSGGVAGPGCTTFRVVRAR
ncbi:MAG: hypothetical protein QM728_14020 [Gordonia sp. (in: high G+C Gram-positive bacteria)]|uniref:hypothetical protein n=1 Tax=Gordonia sp. (in: high G+C Gram-positive bacteria) TaxID=84139 RepID=UPI0039E24869